MIRNEEELEQELEYEEVLKAKQNRSKKFTAFEDKMSRNVVNEVIFIENKQRDKFIHVEDARDDMEKER